MKKMLILLSSLSVILFFAFLYFYTIEKSDSSYARTLRENNFFSKSNIKKDLWVTLSDEFFIPIDEQYPENLRHNYVQNKEYKIFGKIKKKGEVYVQILKNNEIRNINIRSIKYPYKLFYSKKYCYVKVENLKYNKRYVFFTKHVPYEFRKINDVFWVLDEERNQVSIKKENLIFE